MRMGGLDRMARNNESWIGILRDKRTRSDASIVRKAYVVYANCSRRYEFHARRGQ